MTNRLRHALFDSPVPAETSATDSWWPDGFENAQPTWPQPAAAPRAGLTSASSWAELLYCVIGLAPAITFFVVTVTLISVGVSLVVIYVGLPILMFGLLFARAGGHIQRVLARVLLDLPVPGPQPIHRRRPGLWGATLAVLTDPGCWRAVIYHCVKILLAPAAFSVAVSFYAYGLGALTYPLWSGYLPQETASNGTLHRGAQLLPNYFIDTWPRMVVLAIFGVGVLWLAPRVVRFFATLDRVLIAGLLGSTGH